MVRSAPERIQSQEVPRRVLICRLHGSNNETLVVPGRWKFEGSTSQRGDFKPADDAQKSLQFLRTDDGIDVFLVGDTGCEPYLARTSRRH